MYVAAVFQTLQVQVDMIQHSLLFDIVYIWISKFNALISTIY